MENGTLSSRGKHRNYGMLISVSLALLLTLYSMMPWFLWDNNILKTFLVGLFVVTSLSLVRWNFSVQMSLYMIMMLVFTLFHAKLSLVSTNASIFRIASMLPLFFFPLFDLEYKRLFLKWLIKWFAIILAVSLPFFVMWSVGIGLPSSTIVHPNEFYLPFSNYYFFIIGVDLGAFTRFSSVFTEPGHLGMFCAILLYVNNYTWKDWKNVVMTISLVWSFSLAGYVLYVIGFLLYLFCSRKNSGQVVKKLLWALLAFGAVCVVVGAFNSEILEDKIFSRLEYDQDKGITGYNRNTKFFDRKYDNMDFSDLTFGMDPAKYDAGGFGVGNSSYKNFILQDGYVGLLIILVALICYLKVYPSRKGVSLFLLLAASFIQRPYILWEIESFTYLAALTCFHYEQYGLRKKRTRHLRIHESFRHNAET